jgi:hypothetical protein
MTAPVAINGDGSVALIFDRFETFAPTLEGRTATIWTALGTSFGLVLDIWQTKGDNRHGRLCFVGCLGTPILHGACLFVSKPTIFVTVTRLQNFIEVLWVL